MKQPMQQLPDNSVSFSNDNYSYFSSSSLLIKVKFNSRRNIVDFVNVDGRGSQANVFKNKMVLLLLTGHSMWISCFKI
jgi:hypothetical protein